MSDEKRDVVVPEHDQMRFWRLVSKTESCWLWTGGKTQGAQGYGCFQVNHVNYRAHRLAYELLRGPIPIGLQLDHLCRNPSCVNPDHLEPVTARENTLRGIGPSAVVYRTRVCMNGHDLNSSPVYTWPSGKRVCILCRRAARMARYYKAKARRNA